MARHVAPAESRINLTPMLDVVFIMLIFFVVTSTFTRESGIDMNPPEPALRPPPEKVPDNILVRIGINDRIFLQGERVDIRSVRANLERLHAQDGNASLVIDAHPTSTTELLVEVMDSARAAGITAIGFVDRG